MPIVFERVLGTPDEQEWPGISLLRDYKTTFPKWEPSDMKKHAKGLNREGRDFLLVSCFTTFIFKILSVMKF